MTSWPCSASSAAATDESTPPDIATTIRMGSRTNATTKPRRHEEEFVRERLRVFVPSWLHSGRYRLSSQPAELLHQPRQHLDDAIDFLLGGQHPQTETQRVLRPVRGQSH